MLSGMLAKGQRNMLIMQATAIPNMAILLRLSSGAHLVMLSSPEYRHRRARNRLFNVFLPTPLREKLVRLF